MSHEKLFTTVSLGCRTNQYEVEAVKCQLRRLGLREALSHETADIVVINTCSVTVGADSSSRRAIRQMRKAHPGATIIVTGCMAPNEQLLDEKVFFVPNGKKEQLLSVLFPETILPEFVIDRFENHTRAFVKVQDGCNSFCSYCVIPYVRGRSRSRGIEEIVHEVERLVQNGYKEVVLTGINVGDFDGKGNFRLADLVRAVDGVDGLQRLRISSIDPNEVDPGLVYVLQEGLHTCPSMHIVLQSGSNRILKLMNRKYTKQMFYDTVNLVREWRTDCTITTDVIVGFPGETEEEFLETVEMVWKVGFSKVHIFPYSNRPGTRSSSFGEQIPSAEIVRRKEYLATVCEQVAYKQRNFLVGLTCTILTEETDVEESVGYTEHFFEVKLPGVKLPPNQLVDVTIVENTPTHLRGAM